MDGLSKEEKRRKEKEKNIRITRPNRSLSIRSREKMSFTGEGKLIIFRRRSPGKHSLKNVNYEMATRICVCVCIYMYNVCAI